MGRTTLLLIDASKDTNVSMLGISSTILGCTEIMEKGDGEVWEQLEGETMCEGSGLKPMNEWQDGVHEGSMMVGRNEIKDV